MKAKISRRNVLGMLAASAGAIASPGLTQTAPRFSIADPAIAPGPFQGTRASLRNYEVPEWFRNAKFGIWAHWGPQSALEAGDWYARNMYLQGSRQYDYHVQRFGHPSQFGYKDTIPEWKAEKFQPEELISLYKKAGARYFMSMGVHHDNFDMWNSKHQRWNAAKMGPEKDIVGIWAKAARSEGLKFGVSEHLWITYKWFSVAHGNDAHGPLAGVPYDGATQAKDLYVDSDQVYPDFGGGDWNEDGIPVWWKQHWFDRMSDLISAYEPDLLSSDGALPFEEYGLNIVAHLYNTRAKRFNDRVEAVYLSKRKEDVLVGTGVLSRERGVLTDISPRPWESETCIGDWHYKLGMKYKTPKQIIDMMVDVVSRNGNFLLNFPLPASGDLDREDREILDAITKWMQVNSEAIHDTRPWKIAGEGPNSQAAADAEKRFNEETRKDLTTRDVRFTTKNNILYAFVMGSPQYEITVQSLALNTPLLVGKIKDIELLGTGRKIAWEQDSKQLTIKVPRRNYSPIANVFVIRGAIV